MKLITDGDNIKSCTCSQYGNGSKGRETKNGVVIEAWGNNYPQNPIYPNLSPRFGVHVNVELCTPLKRKQPIYQ